MYASQATQNLLNALCLKKKISKLKILSNFILFIIADKFNKYFFENHFVAKKTCVKTNIKIKIETACGFFDKNSNKSRDLDKIFSLLIIT